MISGIVAKSRKPTAISPLSDDPGIVEEAASSAIRDGVGPTPTYRIRSVQAEEGCYLIVEIEEGLEPPYIHISSGQILERTPRGSEPVPIQSRDTLDRLYARGRRGQEWAARHVRTVWEEVGGLGTSYGAVIGIVPTVADGLGLEGVLFRHSTWERLVQMVLRSVNAWHEGSLKNFEVSDRAISLTSESFGERVLLRVDTTDTVRFTLSGDRPRGPLELPGFVRNKFPLVVPLLEDTFGYRGHVIVGAFGRWRQWEEDRQLQTALPPVTVDDLGQEAFADRVQRHIDRSVGTPAWEPECNPPGDPRCKSLGSASCRHRRCSFRYA